MKAFLQHMTSLTGQRDHALLDAALIAALEEVTAARGVRKLEVLRVRDEVRLKPSSCQLHVCVECAASECSQESEPLDAELAAAVRHQHQSSAQKTTPDGDRILWLLVWLDGCFSACLELRNPVVGDSKVLEMAHAFIAIYTNHRNLLDYSQRDSLTNLLNRKTFDQNFSKALRSLARQDATSALPLEERRHPDAGRNQWLAVIDIDHFKNVNDMFGHLYGDEVLLLMANLIRSSFRPQDGLFRFGGEEFVVLLQAAELNDAQRIFERFRSNVEQHHFPQVGQVTVSIGFTHIGLNATPVVILGHADLALYHAKTHGRNQVCYYEALVAAGELKSEVSNDMMEFF
ncbi:GGDEF domain-containing protein [Herminiimonas sp. CN]|uniref:GGDEF domain-containing protein n=1 Tax=Herminiimonas sp. CN TaxID=1349818 RepID=UPI000474280A|nr:GGDEF domain-containing protein [Herminiimonas sp. CN]